MPTYTNTLRLNDNIISVNPLPATDFSLVRAYEYTSKAMAPNVINERDRLQTPDGTDLNKEAIFFETEINNTTNPPIFRQRVIDGALSSGSIQVHEYNTFIPFTYPGIVSSFTASGGNTTAVGTQLQSPVQTEIEATVFEFIQTSSDLVSADFTHDGASGLWKPNQWSSIRIQATGENSNLQRPSAYASSQDFRGYRSEFGTQSVSSDLIRFNGSVITKQFEAGGGSNSATISTINSGPPDPVGSKWVLDISLQPAFVATDGTPYYKKSIVVSETIPTQVNGDMPYPA